MSLYFPGRPRVSLSVVPHQVGTTGIPRLPTGSSCAGGPGPRHNPYAAHSFSYTPFISDVLKVSSRNPANQGREEECPMLEMFATPSDGLIGLLFLLAVLASLGLVRLAESLKELRS